MTDVKKCPQCGAELPADAPAGICPKCLLAVGMVSDTAVHGESSDGAPTTPLPGSTRFVPPTPAALAHLFPQLEILELIGVGGMGAVYKARQPGLDRLVAIKILPPEVGADPAFAQRFTREAQALARLGHQHIVPVYDFGVAQGLYYFIMEYVDGANLRHLIKTGEMKPADALAIVPQICEALQFAHEEGVVHRDIKPENILIDKRGRVKIADFGLARLLGTAAPEVPLTGTNQVLGTLHYMAPEQIQGLRTIDHRADIFSLGVVFYELLTGELPMGHFEPPSKKVAIDVRLDEVVLRALAREPERRYQHANDVKTDIDSIASTTGTVPLAEPASFFSPYWTPTWLMYTAFAFTFAMLLYPVFHAVAGKTFALGRASLLASGASILLLSFLAYLIERCRFDVRKRWSDRGNVAAIVTGILMMVVPHIILSPRDLREWLPDEFVQFSDGEERWLRCLDLGLSMWTIYFTSTHLWLLLGRSIREKRQRDSVVAIQSGAAPKLNTQIPPLDQSQRNEFARESEQQVEERRRAAELAERPPGWLSPIVLALFGLGWLFAGAMWNYGLPGWFTATAVLAAITYQSIQLLLVYVPKLKSELLRQSRLRRGFALVAGLILFVVAMVFVTATQSSVWGFLGNRSSDSAGFQEEPDRLVAALKEANLGSVTIKDLDSWSVGPSTYAAAGVPLLIAFVGFCFALAAVGTVIDTRRYRNTWKNGWRLAISAAALQFTMLVLIEPFFIPKGTSVVPPRVVKCSASEKQLKTAIETWAVKNGYKMDLQSVGEHNRDGTRPLPLAMVADLKPADLGPGPYGSQEVSVSKDGKNYVVKDGRVFQRVAEQFRDKSEVGRYRLSIPSDFDLYRTSWQGVYRPRPPLLITCVTRSYTRSERVDQKSGPDTTTNDAFLKIEAAWEFFPSRESMLWTPLLDGLESQLRAAAETEKVSERAKRTD